VGGYPPVGGQPFGRGVFLSTKENDYVASKLSCVIAWSNGRTMVFGHNGEQLSEYQDDVEKVAKKIVEDADDDTEFWYGVWREGREPMTKAEFAAKYVKE
jgi:hypothetical protein